jgi:hypothetical protein
VTQPGLSDLLRGPVSTTSVSAPWWRSPLAPVSRCIWKLNRPLSLGRGERRNALRFSALRLLQCQGARRRDRQRMIVRHHALARRRTQERNLVRSINVRMSSSARDQTVPADQNERLLASFVFFLF